MHPYGVEDNGSAASTPRSRDKRRVLPIMPTPPYDTDAISITDHQSFKKNSNMFEIDGNGLSVRINPALMTLGHST